MVEAVEYSGADWDPEYAAIADSELLPDLAAQAYGADYPRELRPYGATTWSLLRQISDRLGVRPGETLLDLGCGEAGCGLWLARTAGARLIGLDFSPAALHSAERRAAAFPAAPPYRFVAGSLLSTGLAGSSVDAAVSLDVLTYIVDKVAAFGEVRRVLRPGGRFAFTVHELLPPAVPGGPDVYDHRPLVTAAGLTVVHYGEVDGWREPTRRMYRLWIAHADRLRAELGPDVATTLLAEATGRGGALAQRRQMLLVGVRP